VADEEEYIWKRLENMSFFKGWFSTMLDVRKIG